MANAVRVTGLRSTVSALNRAKRNMPEFLRHAVDKYTDEIVQVARDRVGVDTGALRDSIHSEVAKIKGEVITGKAQAGSPAYVRGEGKYMTDKHGEEVSVLPTSEYAEAHDKGTARRPGTGFMQNSYDFAKAKAKQTFSRVIAIAIRTF